ncbi:MAG: YkgJ family cysteine cluster protein [Sulfurospirillaceae bacterium]|nr:YkgJ family cysteine cluster protein [Sulfurospirillaceae bacterium]
MSTILKQEGYPYAFDAKVCETCAGNCCIGESGYIWVTQEEIKTMAEFLECPLEDFINEYLLKVRYRFTIKEAIYESGYRCIFFDLDKKACRIYAARPKQCRTFPFWDYFKENIKEVESECPGIIRL